MSIIAQIVEQSPQCLNCPVCNYDAPDVSQFNIHKRGPRHIERVQRIIQIKTKETERRYLESKYNKCCIKLLEYERLNEAELNKESIEYLKLINEKNNAQNELSHFDILYIQELLL